MLLIDHFYNHPHIKDLIFNAMLNIRPDRNAVPVIVCIGTDLHLLDTLGPLTGSILNDAGKGLKVFGTLENPVHAQNLAATLALINKSYPHRFEIAVDASLGSAEDIGKIKLRDEPIIPGKALFKNLSPVGDISFIGVMAGRHEKKQLGKLKNASLRPTYNMATIISSSIIAWLDYIMN